MINKGYLRSPVHVFQITIAVVVGLLLGLFSGWLSPLWVIVGLFSLVVAFAGLKRPEIFIIIYLIITSSIFQQTKANSISIAIGKIYPTDLLLFFPLAILIIRRVVEPGFKLISTPLDLPLLIFLSSAFISTFIAIYSGVLTLNQSLGQVRIVASYLLFFVITNLIRDKRQLDFLIKSFLFLATVVAIATIFQYVLGRSQVFLAGRIQTVSASDQVFRVIPPGQSTLVVAFLVIFSFLVMEPARAINIPRLIQFGLLGLTIVVTFYRASWVMIGVNILLFGFWVRSQERQRLVLWICITVLAVALILVAVLQQPQSRGAKLARAAFDRLTSLTEASTYTDPESSLRWRDFEYSFALPHILANPIIGLGLGAQYRPWVSPKDWEGYDGRSFVHNGNLWVLMDTGLFGFLGLLLFLLGLLIRGLTNWRTISEPRLQAMVLSFGISALLVLVVSNVEPYVMTESWTPVIAVMAGITEVILGRLTRARIEKE